MTEFHNISLDGSIWGFRKVLGQCRDPSPSLHSKMALILGYEVSLISCARTGQESRRWLSLRVVIYAKIPYLAKTDMGLGVVPSWKVDFDRYLTVT